MPLGETTSCTASEIEELVMSIARKNQRGGYGRIEGELLIRKEFHYVA